jgi:chromatin remodeling complex protein RSC6
MTKKGNNELVSVSGNLVESFNIVIDSLALIKLQISTLQQKIRLIEKNVKKELKQIKHLDKKNQDINKIIKKPSGFAKPIKVTEELCEFMNRPIGTEIARTEVTKALISYIEHNNLKDQYKKQNIIPDLKLKNLLGITNEEIPQLNFFNIQKYMNKHFISSKNNIDITKLE